MCLRGHCWLLNIQIWKYVCSVFLLYCIKNCNYSPNFVQNTFHFNKYLTHYAKDTRRRECNLHESVHYFCPVLTKIGIWDFSETPQHQISWNIMQWFSSCFMCTGLWKLLKVEIYFFTRCVWLHFNYTFFSLYHYVAFSLLLPWLGVMHYPYQLVHADIFLCDNLHVKLWETHIFLYSSCTMWKWTVFILW